MKTIYYKTKAIISGVFLSNTDKELYGYTFHRNKISKEKIDNRKKFNINEYQYDPIHFYMGCLATIDGANFEYETIEQKDYNDLQVSEATKLNKPDIILKKYPIIVEDIINVEKLIRLLYNIPIFFREILIDLYDDKKKKITTLGHIRNNSYSQWAFPEINPIVFSNNTRLMIDKSVFDNTNERGRRAIELYSASFETENINIRFALIFSAIESLFHRRDKTRVEENIEKCIPYLLYPNNTESQELLATRIKSLYGKRSKFIHGSSKTIIEEIDEIELRNIARRTILAYIIYEINSKLGAQKIINNLRNRVAIDINTILFTAAINASSFREQQENIINEVERVTGKEIPKALRDKLLSKIIS